jgi:hypothetical protein
LIYFIQVIFFLLAPTTSNGNPIWRIYLRSKGLYRITLRKETTPIDVDKKVKWDNRNDEPHGLIKMSISPDLRFHLQSIDKPKEAWEKIESVFGKHNII